MKVLLLDADGVVLQKGEYFSERFAREYNVPLSSVVEFFKGPYVACQKGEADLKDELQPFLEKWNWQGSTEDFLGYWFKYDVVLNPGIKEVVANLREKGVKVYLASNNEKYRAKVIEDLLREEELLDGVYFSSHIKVRKDTPGFFQHVIDELGVEPQEVTFVDNDQKNVDSAESLGIDARIYSPEILTELRENTVENKVKFI
jgi:putative hydrolase of the HAD superfamily